MRIALYQPDIPQNAGTIMRLAACLGLAVDLIEPAGFDASDRNLRRAGLDYLVKAPHPIGGFRYNPGQAGDTSVTGWCLQALKSGSNAGFSVKRETLYKVMNYLDTAQTQDDLRQASDAAVDDARGRGGNRVALASIRLAED